MQGGGAKSGSLLISDDFILMLGEYGSEESSVGREPG
jgi:hypothetical protein